MTEPITSTRNERVKAVAALQRTRERRAAGRFLVEGPNAVAEALADDVVESVFATADRIADYRDAGVAVVEVSDHVLERLADSRTPQGVVAVARLEPGALDDVVGRGVLIVCDRVSDPGNVGAIIRVADAAGAVGVVVTTGSVDPWNPKAVRATTGSITHLPIVVDVGLEEVVTACRASNQEVVALDAGGADDVFSLERRTRPVALVFGNEAHGLDPVVLGTVDRTVAIPHLGRAESLNLATAVAVTAYAAARADLPAPPG
ncbi:MAG: RNA methyltransferase [Actinobacteria bacterium]|nr:RNA methyltransferase [Actinomycetota bacterium]